MMRSRDYKHTFSIRKLTIGAVSVMFGALIFGVSTTQTHADTVDNGESAQTEEVQNNKRDSQEQSGETTQTSAAATKEATSQENANAEEQNNQNDKTVESAKVENQEDANKVWTSVKTEAQTQIKQDDTTKVASKDAQKASVQATTENKTETSKTVEAPKSETPKTEVPAQPTQNEDAKTETTTTLDVAKASKEKNNTNGLITSLFRSEDVDTVNINDWDYSNLTDGNVEVKTKSDVTYTGDVVFPNTYDLIKAGIITDPNGKAYVANGTLQIITNTPGVTSITISKNGGKKLYVKDTTIAYAFGNQYGRNNDIRKLDVGALDVSNVTVLDQTFEKNPNLTEIDGLDKWDVSHVTTMRNIFYGDPKLTSEALSGIANWNTENLESLYAAFQNDSGLTNLDFLKNWNTSKLDTMVSAFAYCPNLTNIDGLSNWNTENLTDLGSAFIGTGITNLDALRNWNTSNLVSMGATFYAAGNLSDISGLANWDVSKVTNFASTFLYDSKIQGLVNLSNWEINNNANTFDMFYPGGRDATPLMVLVKSGAENINKGTTVFGAGSSQHYLYRVEVNGQIVETVPTKAINSDQLSALLSDIITDLDTRAASLGREGYTFSWQKENEYGNTGVYQLYVATWTQPTQPTEPNKPTQPTEPNKPTQPTNNSQPDQPTTPEQPTNSPTTPSEPTTPVQPTSAPTEPATPTAPTQPSNNPVLPEKNPSSNQSDNGKQNENNSSKSSSNNGKTVKPHAEKPTNNTGKKIAPEVHTAKAEQEHPVTLSNKRAEVNSNKNQKQAETKLPQTGVKESSAILGLILAGLGLFGLAVDRKRKNN